LSSGGQQRLRLRKNVETVTCFGRFVGALLTRIELIEAAHDFACEFDVCDLVFAYGNEVGLINNDVGRLEDWISEEAVVAEVFILYVVPLLFVRGDALEPSERRDHGQQQVE